MKTGSRLKSCRYRSQWLIMIIETFYPSVPEQSSLYALSLKLAYMSCNEMQSLILKLLHVTAGTSLSLGTLQAGTCDLTQLDSLSLSVWVFSAFFFCGSRLFHFSTVSAVPAVHFWHVMRLRWTVPFGWLYVNKLTYTEKRNKPVCVCVCFAHKFWFIYKIINIIVSLQSASVIVLHTVIKKSAVYRLKGYFMSSVRLQKSPSDEFKYIWQYTFNYYSKLLVVCSK